MATFGLIWWPFLQNLDLAKQVLVRIFPLDRGLFEDKVANFWCSLNVALKLKDKYDQDTLALGSLAVTVLTVLPSNILLLARPSKANFLGTLLTTSLAFFLFSYQVHEKSILLAAFPALMNLVGLNLEPLYQKVNEIQDILAKCNFSLLGTLWKTDADLVRLHVDLLHAPIAYP